MTAMYKATPQIYLQRNPLLTTHFQNKSFINLLIMMKCNVFGQTNLRVRCLFWIYQPTLPDQLREVITALVSSIKFNRASPINLERLDLSPVAAVPSP